MKSITIIGAGAAGLFCAAMLSKQGAKVTIIDNGKRPGRKILMSGGGKCNFTNLSLSAENYISANPHFCKSALSRFNQWDFLTLINQFDIPWHERTHGQLFCDRSAQDIVNILTNLCHNGRVEFYMQTQLEDLQPLGNGFKIFTNKNILASQIVVIATGGLSMPALGMTTTSYQIAKQLGLIVKPARAGLVPFTLHKPLLDKLSGLSGITVPSRVTAQNSVNFKENVLFTHRGLSGPAILQVSNYWQTGEHITINLLPDDDFQQFITEQQRTHPNQTLKNTLSSLLPKRLVESLIKLHNWPNMSLKQLRNNHLQLIKKDLTNWQITPSGTEGYRTAEVTLGGVSTDNLSSKTMAAKSYPNLYFIGEVIDVTGWLGGYNFQWAWSSAAACAAAIHTSMKTAR